MNKLLKNRLRERANGLCEYCLSPESYSSSPFVGEHIIPIAKDGDDQLENLAFACAGCNNFKYDCVEAYDSVSGTWVPLFHPRQDVWSEHFRWNTNCTQMIGISPTGRATIQRLKLNRPQVTNLRKILFERGEHPA